MMKRYEVQVSRHNTYGFGFTTVTTRAFRTARSAVTFASAMRNPDLECTSHRGPKLSVEVVDAKSKKTLWTHEGNLVPSVGELGWF